MLAQSCLKVEGISWGWFMFHLGSLFTGGLWCIWGLFGDLRLLLRLAFGFIQGRFKVLIHTYLRLVQAVYSRVVYALLRVGLTCIFRVRLGWLACLLAVAGCGWLAGSVAGWLAFLLACLGWKLKNSGEN